MNGSSWKRAALPGPPDRVGQVEFELGPVEGAFARQLLVGGARSPASAASTQRFRAVPGASSLEAVIRPRRELDRIIGEAEIAIDPVEQGAERLRLVLHLVLGAEDVGVVLGELAYPHQAVERAMRLVPVAAAELGHADREVAIGFDPLAEDLDVRRAVHRLQSHQVRRAGEDRRIVVHRRDLVGDDEHVRRGTSPQWPEASHSLASISCGVLISS